MKSIFEELFEKSPVAMLLVNNQRVIQLVNRHAEQLFQYERSELVGHHIELLIPENSQQRHPALVEGYFKEPVPRQMGQGRTLHGIKKDRSLFPVEVGLNPVEKNGEVFVLSSVIDITERHRAEERFKAAFEAAPNGMLMIDQTRKIVLVNKKTEEIFGYSRAELIGYPIEQLVPDDFKAPHPTFVDSYIKKPSPRAMGIGRELFGRHRSGKLVAVEIGLQPVQFEGEVFVISSIVDITQRKTSDAEIKRKTEEIEEFSYRTSHDLRSPLKSIAGMTECILEELEEKNYEGAKKDVDKISQLTTRLLKLIEDILMITKVEASQEQITAFDFDDYAKHLPDKFDAALKENQVAMSFSFMHRKPLMTQSTRLIQVLDNLIINAIKYSDKNKQRREVKIQSFNDMSRFFIHVEDNGLGLPEARQTEVFGMFKRFHSAAIPGSGLGLYLTKKQIDKIGGKISFESSPQGTTFYIEFQLPVE